jgi:hypothetical protein
LPISQDVYVSFRGSNRRDFGELTHPQPVVFVDLDSDDIELLRGLPPMFLGQRHGTLLLRLPSAVSPDVSHMKALAELVGRWPLLPRVAVLRQPIGSVPEMDVLHGAQLEPAEYASILKRARAVELEALLELGQAIWRPTAYHYRLITGEHVDSYIKLGDAIREPRDAAALASWMHGSLGMDVGFVFDTGTMTPIAQALRLAAVDAGLRLGPAAMLDNYPRTGVDLDTVIDRASGDGGRVVVVLSVSSSGSLRERVLGALHRKGDSLASRQVIVLVDKSGRCLAGVETWTPLPGQEPLARPGASDAAGCVFCRRPGRAPVVPINPFTFDAMLPAQLRQVVPDIKDPSANRPLWEAAQQTGALAVERKGNIALRRNRSDKVPMGIVMRAQRLIADERFRGELLKRIEKCQDEDAMSRDSDLVLVPEHEMLDSFPEFWEAVGPAIAPRAGTPLPFPTDDEFGDALRKRILQAEEILVFQLGTVSGATLQRALVGIQDARGDRTNFDIHAFVVHLRPATSREWLTIRNSYGHVGSQPQLRCAWKSILPDRSPLREERALLRKLDLDKFDDDGKAFVTKRLKLCSGEYEGDRPAILWGSSPESRLTPNAIYGQRLDAVSTYVAVGSAMSAALVDPVRTLPEFRVFEIAAMVRSYYDPLILGCFLRWVRPHEVFWGWTATEAKTTALHMLDRAVGRHRQILVPEMLLAAAQGKLTQEAALVSFEAAQVLLEEDIPEEIRASIAVGLQLAGDIENLPPTEGVYSEV